MKRVVSSRVNDFDNAVTFSCYATIMLTFSDSNISKEVETAATLILAVYRTPLL